MKDEPRRRYPVAAVLVAATAALGWCLAMPSRSGWAASLAVVAAAIWGAAAWSLLGPSVRGMRVGQAGERPVPASQQYEEFTRSLSLIVGVEELLSTALARISNLSGVERIVVLLSNAAGEPYRTRAAVGWTGDELVASEVTEKARLVRWLYTNETYVVLADSPAVKAFLHPGERQKLEELGVQVIWPLIAANRLVGMIWGAGEEPVIRSRAAAVWTMVPQMALGVENALLYEQQRQRTRRLYRAERLATTGQLAAGAAHEIRNPLASIRTTMQYLKPRLEHDPDAAELVGDLFEETDRIDAIVQGMLSFARPVEPKLEQVDLGHLLGQTLRLVESTAREGGVRIETRLPEEPALVHADADQLKQVFLNVAMNGIQAMPDGGVLRVSLADAGEERKLRWRVTISDTGVGVAEEDLDRIFDPFYTTKAEGTGLGLAVCHAIVQSHGGEIEVRSELGQGTQVEIRLQEQTAHG